MKLENISLHKIDFQDDRFRISYSFPLNRFILSIKKVGLINPPVVTLRDNKYIFASGWKRAISCQESSLSPLPVFVMDEKDDLKVFQLVFYENLATREYSLLEKAEILCKLKKFGEEEGKIVKRYLPLLAIPPIPESLDFYLSISEFEPVIKKVIYEKNMPLSSLKLLVEFSSKERRLLLPLFLPLGQNKQKEIFEDILEISRKKNISVEKIISSPEIRKIFHSDNLSPLQKANRIRLLLKKERYPYYFSWRESFDSVLKKINWPEGIAVNPSAFFEEEEISVSFSFRNREEFKNKLKKLHVLSSREEFTDLFNPVADE